MSRRPLVVRRLVAAAVLPLAVTGLAACGGDEEAGSDSGSGSEVFGGDGAAEELEPGQEVKTEDFVEILETSFEEATTSHMKMTTSNAAGDMTAEGDADYTADPAEISMTMSGGMLGGEEMQVIMVDNVMYMKSPSLGEKYMKIDLADPNNPLGGAFTEQLDPQAMLRLVEDGLQQATYVGEEEVDGATTDHYSAVVDSQTIIEGMGQEIPQGVELPETITYEMFFDEDGLYRRIDVDMGGALGKVDMSFTDWGKDVSIEAPPAAEVTDFPTSAVG